MAFNSTPEFIAIAETLRKRIVLHEGSEIFVLHEGALAEEFGLSRTPIRQVLQALAIQHLVITKPGKGTIATPLEKGRFIRDIRSEHDITLACLHCMVSPIPSDHLIQLVGLEEEVNSYGTTPPAAAAFADLVIDYGSCMVPLVDDELLKQAFLAAYYRMLRWRVGEYRADPARVWARMKSLTSKTVSRARSKEPGASFQALYEHQEKVIKQARTQSARETYLHPLDAKDQTHAA